MKSKQSKQEAKTPLTSSTLSTDEKSEKTEPRIFKDLSLLGAVDLCHLLRTFLVQDFILKLDEVQCNKQLSTAKKTEMYGVMVTDLLAKAKGLTSSESTLQSNKERLYKKLLNYTPRNLFDTTTESQNCTPSTKQSETGKRKSMSSGGLLVPARPDRKSVV